MIDSVFSEKDIEYSVAMEVAGRETVKAYVGMDLGVSIINEYYLTGEDMNRFFVKDVCRFFGEAERGVVTRKEKYLSTAARGFLDLI